MPTQYTADTDLEASVIRCPYSKCHARLLQPKDPNIHALPTNIQFLKVDPEQSTEHDGLFVLVADVWDFDNIGVSRPTEQFPGVERLLICSECDRGPLGMAMKIDDVLKYAVHLSSVVYE